MAAKELRWQKINNSFLLYSTYTPFQSDLFSSLLLSFLCSSEIIHCLQSESLQHRSSIISHLILINFLLTLDYFLEGSVSQNKNILCYKYSKSLEDNRYDTSITGTEVFILGPRKLKYWVKLLVIEGLQVFRGVTLH